MGGGLFNLYVFETNGAQSAYADLLAAWVLGQKLYASPFGLLTRELPSGQAVAGTDTLIAITTKVPTSSDLTLGIKLVI
jgi:hypothetical protein